MVQLVQEAMVYHVSKVQKGGPENAKILLDSQIRESRSGNSAGFKLSLAD
jgi:hypothetical protein